MRRPFLLAISTFITLPALGAELPCSGSSSGMGCFDAAPMSGPAEPSPFRWFGRGEVLRLGQVAGTAVLRYASSPAELVAPSPDPAGRLIPVVRYTTRLELRVAAGLGRHIDLTLSQPMALSQAGSGPDAVLSQSPPPLASNGFGDPRLGLRVRLPENLTHFAWTLRLELTLPLGDERAYLGNRSATEAVAVNAHWSKSGFSLVTDAGIRLARPTRFGDAQLGTSAFLGLGVDYAPIRGDDLIHVSIEALLRPSLIPAPDLSRSPNGRGDSEGRYHADWVMPAEWLMSLSSRPLDADLWFSFGAGMALPFSHRTICEGNSTPTACDTNGSQVDPWFIAPSTPRYQVLGSVAARY
jgi:hypothetical protein